ncbi:MAG: hypothetical protein AB7F41_13090 [Methylocystis sp.]
MTTTLDRRRFLRGAGGAALAGFSAPDMALGKFQGPPPASAHR